MAIVRENQSVTFDGTNNLTSKTISYTCTGSDLVLLVFVGNWSDTNVDHISGVTYNTVTVPRIRAEGTAGTSVQCYLHALLGPATGTHDVVVTFGTAVPYGAAFGIASYTGVGAIGTNAGRFSTSQASPFSDNISISPAGGMAVDGIESDENSALAKNAAQTLIGSIVGSGSEQFGMSELLDATAMSWTTGTGTRGAHIIVELEAAAAAPANWGRMLGGELNRLVRRI